MIVSTIFDLTRPAAKCSEFAKLAHTSWTDTSLRYRHWRMCFERLLQAFARWQPGILFDIAAQPILEYRWIDNYSQPSLRTQFKVATVYSIHTQLLSWCSTGLVPNVLLWRDEGSGKPCAVDRASQNIGIHSGLEPGTSGSTIQKSNHYTTAAHQLKSVEFRWVQL